MKIALATVGTTGDIRPFGALARALRDAGHAVEAISWELHRQELEGAGISFRAAGPTTSWDEIADAARAAAAARNPLDQVAVLRDFHLRDAAAHYRQLRDALPGHDLVLLHGIHSLAEAAVRDLGLRWATAVFDPVLLPTGSHPPAGMPPMGPFNRAGWWVLDRLLARAGGPLRAALAEAGSPSAPAVRLFRGRSPLLHLVACSPAIATPPGDLPPHVAFTGAWQHAEPPPPLPPDVERFMATGAPPAVVTFGSMAMPEAERLGTALDGALRHANLRAVVQPGPSGLEVSASSELMLIGGLDHRALFARASVVVHHGGAGTTHTVAAAGVPSVVVPHVGDQAYWAQRLHRLGVAPRPVPAGKVDAGTLAERLREVTAVGRMRAAASALARSMADENGLANAVARLEAVGRPS